MGFFGFLRELLKLLRWLIVGVVISFVLKFIYKAHKAVESFPRNQRLMLRCLLWFSIFFGFLFLCTLFFNAIFPDPSLRWAQIGLSVCSAIIVTSLLWLFLRIMIDNREELEKRRQLSREHRKAAWNNILGMAKGTAKTTALGTKNTIGGILGLTKKGVQKSVAFTQTGLEKGRQSIGKGVGKIRHSFLAFGRKKPGQSTHNTSTRAMDEADKANKNLNRNAFNKIGARINKTGKVIGGTVEKSLGKTLETTKKGIGWTGEKFECVADTIKNVSKPLGKSAEKLTESIRRIIRRKDLEDRDQME